MANTKISQLPEYTGSTLDGYMVFNNSGETTTYKYKLPVDLNNGGSPSPLEFFGTNGSIKVSGETMGSQMGTSVKSVFLGTGYSLVPGAASYSLVSGFNNNPESLGIGSPVNYIYQFGSSNNNRAGGGHSYQFGLGNGINSATQNYQFGYGNNFENGGYNFQFGEQNNHARFYNVSLGKFNTAYGYYGFLMGLSNYIGGRTGGYADTYNYQFITGENNKIWANSDGNTILNGKYNGITADTGNHTNAIIASSGSTMVDKTMAVMIGTSGRTADTNYCAFVENLKIFNYTNLNFADDTAAAAGGVVLGQLYHNNGALRVRIV